MQNIEDVFLLECGANVCIGNSICAMWNHPWFWDSKLLAQLKSAACHEIQGKRSIIGNPNCTFIQQITPQCCKILRYNLSCWGILPSMSINTKHIANYVSVPISSTRSAIGCYAINALFTGSWCLKWPNNNGPRKDWSFSETFGSTTTVRSN